ncbi:MAG: PhoH family protein [Geminicoccaceae bacterium]|nr:PhoH family protein [Geminicoccaceae bacterium]MCX8101366.1 PhoH family protein [Geminicoccaceae bacterium]
MKTASQLEPLRGASQRVRFDDNAICAVLFGQHHVNLARIEQKLPVTIVSRGNEVFIQGENEGDVHAAAAVLEDLYGKLRSGIAIGREEVDAALRMRRPDAPMQERAEHHAIRTERKLIVARSANQLAYLRALERFELVFALGPAGTGKTYLAVAMAVSFLKQHRVERLILSRPAVEAGERLGFLPGDMKEKVDPYLRPLYDALRDMLPEGKVQMRIESGQIEIAPLAYMRGRTLSNSFVILDEAQNTTPAQMKMFLTRLGEGSRMVITGDPTQTDLPPGTTSGLADAVERLAGIGGIATVRFDRGDIVRHPLVGAIIDAYEGTGEPVPETRGGSRRPRRTPSSDDGQRQ